MNYSMKLEQLKLIGKGDHMVMLYDDDYIYNAEIIAAYISSRIIRNEKCLYITGDISDELIIEILERQIDIEKAIRSGQLSILSNEDAYSKEGYFNPDNMIKLIKKLSLEAIAEGYDAFAITGELSWLIKYNDGFDRIMEYEYKLNKEIFNKYPVSAICRYNLNKFSNEMIKNIIEVHPLIIWEGTVHENPFYFEVVDSENIDIVEYQVKTMLNKISEFTNTKGKFYNELQEKENINKALHLNLMESIIVSLTSLLENHDMYTKNHSENVAKLSKEIAIALGLTAEEISQIYFAGLVHDIGKTIIPSEIINKEGRLTIEEFEIVKKHSNFGYEALSKTSELKEIADIVLQHHEKINGTGYPLGNCGDTIPLGSRILSVADAFDAMINERPYKETLSREKAVEELHNCSGTQFDKNIVAVLVKII